MIFGYSCVYVSVGNIPRSQSLGLRLCQTIFERASVGVCSFQHCMRDPVFPYPRQYWVLSSFFFPFCLLVILVGVMWSLDVMINGGQNFGHVS